MGDQPTQDPKGMAPETDGGSTDGRPAGGFWNPFTALWNGIEGCFAWIRLQITGDDSPIFGLPVDGEATALDQRIKVQKALVKIEEDGFYTLGGVVSLMRDFYAKERDKALDVYLKAERGTEAWKKARDTHRAMLKHTGPRLGTRRITVQLRRLLDAADRERICREPKGTRLTLVHDFLEKAGFLDAPIPVNLIKDKPDVMKKLVYAGVGHGDLVFHSMRMATGLDDPGKDFKDNDTDPHPFEGAVFQSYVFDNPYLKRGVFVVRSGDERGPVEVEYYEGWSSELQSTDHRDLASRPADPYVQRYEEYYRGYMLDQGYDSYIFLFGPQDPGLKFNDSYNALLALKGLQKLLKANGKEDGAGWDASKENVADYLRGLDEKHVIETLKTFLESSDQAVQQAVRPQPDGGEGLHVIGQGQGTSVVPFEKPKEWPDRLRANFTGRAAMLETVFKDPLLKGLPEIWKQEDEKQDMAAEARELKNALWKMFEVDGRPAQKIGNHRRIRTIYMEGATRNALTPHILKGSVVAFDNISKSEMLLERTIMYRLGAPTTNAVDLANMTVIARNRADRFDMRQPDEMRDHLARFEPKYREIFLALGYDVAPAAEEHKPYRVDPLISNTASDGEDMEFVIE